MSSSRSNDMEDHSAMESGLPSLDSINHKLGSMYFRFQRGEGLRYTTTNAFLTWKAMPSTKSAIGGRPFYIFLHDYGSSSRIFNNVASKIKNFCLAIDLKGWGRSDDTKDEENRAYSITQMKNQIPPIVNLLQGEHFILLGHGMGGKVALLYASQQPPKNLIGLVLLAPAPLSNLRLSREIMDKYKAAYTKKGAERKLESFIKNTLAGSRIDDADLRNLIEDGSKDTPLAKEAWLDYGMQENFSYGIGRIEVPVLIRAGVEDQVVPFRDLNEDCKRIAECRPQLMKGCGHLLPLEDDSLPEGLESWGIDAEIIEAGTSAMKNKLKNLKGKKIEVKVEVRRSS